MLDFLSDFLSCLLFATQPRNQPQQRLSDRAHSLTIFDTELGLHKSDGKSPYLYPSKRHTPDKSSQITRRDRQIHLQHKPITELIIPKDSATGTAILEAWEEYKGFSSKYQDDLASPEADEPDEDEIAF